jgi:hypothetical protein
VQKNYFTHKNAGLTTGMGIGVLLGVGHRGGMGMGVWVNLRVFFFRLWGYDFYIKFGLVYFWYWGGLKCSGWGSIIGLGLSVYQQKYFENNE